MLRLEIQATDAKDMQSKILDIAGSSGLAAFATEAILAELRERMAKDGLVVKVVKFADSGEETGDVAEEVPETVKPPTKKELAAAAKLAATQAAHEAAAEAAAAATTTREPPKTVDAASDTAKAMAEKSNVTTPTVDDVKTALNAFAAVHGQLKARAKIETAGGSPRLMDVKPEKYAGLIEALKVAA